MKEKLLALIKNPHTRNIASAVYDGVVVGITIHYLRLIYGY